MRQTPIAPGYTGRAPLVAFNCPPAVRDQLRAAAEATGESVAAVIRAAIDAHLAQLQAEEVQHTAA